MEDYGSNRMNRDLMVVAVRASLSPALVEKPGLTKALVNRVSANRLFYGPFYPPFLTLLGLTFHGRHE
jgi:hypothetical protein